jgi:site-specific recombinase XerD
MEQLPLFSSDPQTQDEITRQTPLIKTFDLFRLFLKREGKSVHTITSFISDLKLVTECLEPERIIGQIQTSDLNAFLHWLEYDRRDSKGKHIPCSRKSYARRVTTLKVYFKWLHGLKAIPHNPAEAILQRSGPAPLSNVLSMEQIRAALDAAQRMKKGDHQDMRPEMLFRLLLDTGIKKSETIRLTPADIDRANPNNPILMVRHKVRNTYKERRIDLAPEWVKVLDLYREQYPPKPQKEEIITCTARNLEYILTDVGEAAGIPFKLSFEVMRWTCAVRDYRLGMDERSLREKLGLSEVSWYETSRKIKQLSEQLAGGQDRDHSPDEGDEIA